MEDETFQIVIYLDTGEGEGPLHLEDPKIHKKMYKEKT